MLLELETCTYETCKFGNICSKYRKTVTNVNEKRSSIWYPAPECTNTHTRTHTHRVSERVKNTNFALFRISSVVLSAIESVTLFTTLLYSNYYRCRRTRHHQEACSPGPTTWIGFSVFTCTLKMCYNVKCSHAPVSPWRITRHQPITTSWNGA